ncbi:MAG: hypothetical protein ABI765_06115 [Gemmatimonadota bacterium]
MASPIGTIVRTDVRLRWRRTSTIVTLLLMIVFAYVVVPDFRLGHTVMVVDGHRAVYNSTALSLSTGLFASFFLGLFGFYLVGNALRRDLETGTGYIIAATPIRNIEYLGGKLAGNIVFLGSIVAVYLVGVLAMHLLRGEAAIEPLTYLVTYLLLIVPSLVFAATFALAFECLPLLAGRGGDILYLFIWIVVLSVAGVVLAGRQAEPGWGAIALDVFGMGTVLAELHRQGLGQGLGIGSTLFDPSLAPVVLQHIPVSLGLVTARLASAFLTAPLFLLGLWSFHRFDPARVRSAAKQGGKGILAQLGKLLKPLTRLLLPIAAWGGRSRWRFGGQIVSDAAVTFMLSPITLFALVALSAWGFMAPLDKLRGAVLPVTFFLLVLALADIATRDRAVGAGPMLDGMPRLRSRRALWKLASASLVALLFTLVPMLRLLRSAPGSAAALLVGTLFTASLAVALGAITGTPKTFAALFLFFLYLVLNGGALPGFDFAGWTGLATPSVTLGYFIATLVLAGGAMAWQRVARD